MKRREFIKGLLGLVGVRLIGPKVAVPETYDTSIEYPRSLVEWEDDQIESWRPALSSCTFATNWGGYKPTKTVDREYTDEELAEMMEDNAQWEAADYFGLDDYD